MQLYKLKIHGVVILVDTCLLYFKIYSELVFTFKGCAYLAARISSQVVLSLTVCIKFLNLIHRLTIACFIIWQLFSLVFRKTWLKNKNIFSHEYILRILMDTE